MKSLALRMLGFTGFPLLGLLTPILVLPIISRLADSVTWTTIIASIAIGTFAGTVGLLGWNVLGPIQIIERPSDEQRFALYVDSLRTRLIACLAIIPLAVLLAAAISPNGTKLLAASYAVSSSLIALSPAWFCIGVGRPVLLGLYDTLPRFIAAAVSIPLLTLTHSLYSYPMLVTVTWIASIFLFVRKIRPVGQPLKSARLGRVFHEQFGPASINLMGNAYSYAPVPFGSMNSLVSAAGLASGDQVYRYALFTVSATANALQSWIFQTKKNSYNRQIIALSTHGILGLVGGSLIAVFGPTATSILFGSRLAADTHVMIAYGIAFASLAFSTPFCRNILIPNGKIKFLLISTVCSSLSGLCVMAVGASHGSVLAIASGVSVGEVIFLLLVAGYGIRHLPDTRGFISDERLVKVDE